MRRPAIVVAVVCLLAGVGFAADSGTGLPSADDVRATVEHLVACGTRHTLSGWEDPKRGIGCARDFIVAELTAAASGNPAAKVMVDKFEATSPRTRDVPAKLENVYLVVPGTDAARNKTVVLISGHYDSMCSDIMNSTCDAPGADDDASGTAVVIAAAKLEAAKRTRATVVYAALAGEEQGLLGGKRLLAWTKEQGYTVGGVFNNDIVGASNGVDKPMPRVFCDEDATTPARNLGLWLEERMPGLARPVFRKDRFGRGGDHLPFLEAGLPAVRFTEPREDYRHQHQTPRTEDGVEYGDLTKFMDFAFLASVARLNAEAAVHLADAPAPPTSVICEGAVKPDTTVTFEAEPDAERKEFEILTRDTRESRWTVKKTVPAPGAITLEGVRIDDFDFAVRAVGANGERSIAVFAKPQVRRPAGMPPAAAPASPPPK